MQLGRLIDAAFERNMTAINTLPFKTVSFTNYANEATKSANINTRISAEVMLLAARLLSHIKGRFSRPCFVEETAEST